MKCKLCGENFDTKYRIPRNLICGHCFCDQCLKIYLNSDEIDCPKCNKKSPSKLPICYAIYELIEGEDHSSKNIFCPLHPMERIEFHCKDDDKYLCTNCAITIHKDHNLYSTKVESIGNDIKRDFTFNFNSLKQKLEYLTRLKLDIEKSEDYLSKIWNHQTIKLNQIYDDISNRKREKLEDLNQYIDNTYSQQIDKINALLIQNVKKIDILNIYCNKLKEQLLSFESCNTYLSEIAEYNMIKTEDEFRKFGIELDEYVSKYSVITNIIYNLPIR